MIDINEFKRIELLVAEVVSVTNNLFKINCGDAKYKIKLRLDVNLGDKMVVGVLNDRILIPSVEGAFLTVDEDVEVGSRIS